MSGSSGQLKRDTLSFFITLFVYLSLFLLWNHYASKMTASQPSSGKITLALNDFVKEPPEREVPIVEKEEPQEEVLPEEEPIEEKAVEKEPIEKEPVAEEPPPEPVVEPKAVEPIVKRAEPRPVVKPELKKKSPGKIVRKKRHKRKKPAFSKSGKKSSSPPHRRQRRAHGGSRGSSLFVARLRAKIDAHKSYPRIARKRGMQGSVRVKFRITATGRLAGLNVSGPRIFINSAREAVKRAFPLSTRDASLPLTVNLTLNYHLKR